MKHLGIVAAALLLCSTPYSSPGQDGEPPTTQLDPALSINLSIPGRFSFISGKYQDPSQTLCCKALNFDGSDFGVELSAGFRAMLTAVEEVPLVGQVLIGAGLNVSIAGYDFEAETNESARWVYQNGNAIPLIERNAVTLATATWAVTPTAVARLWQPSSISSRWVPSITVALGPEFLFRGDPDVTHTVRIVSPEGYVYESGATIRTLTADKVVGWGDFAFGIASQLGAEWPLNRLFADQEMPRISIELTVEYRRYFTALIESSDVKSSVLSLSLGARYHFEY